MRILLCSPCRVDPRLGAAKMLMELGDALRAQGAAVTLVGPEDVGAKGIEDHPARLAAFLAREAGRFDVVDFDHKRLAYKRGLLPDGVLAVCRGQLLQHHALAAPVPAGVGGLARLRARAGRRKRQVLQGGDLRQSTANFRAADLASVLNRQAADTLVALGVAPARVLVFPNALEEGRAAALRAVSEAPPAAPAVAFIGMFSPRKGGPDLPLVARRLFARVPGARLRLLGTKGMLGTAEEVVRAFPADLRSRVDVTPSFAPEALPELLAGCAAGVFPSYAEGFPLGVLEMLAAALPVVAYDAPGAPEMVPPAWIVPVGDPHAVADKLADLLSDPARLAAARREARAASQRFDWGDIARGTLDAYREAVERLRASPPALSTT